MAETPTRDGSRRTQTKPRLLRLLVSRLHFGVVRLRRTLRYAGGIPSHLYFEDKARGVLAARQNPGRGFAVLIVSLDRFQAVSEALGYTKWRQLVEVVEQRFRSVARRYQPTT